MSVESEAVEAERARTLVERHLRELEGPVLRSVAARLRRSGAFVPAPDVEAAYSRAWHGVYEKTLRGENISNLEGLLADITYNRSLDAYRQRHQDRHDDESVDSLASTVDLVEIVNDQHRINELLLRLGSRLNDKESTAVSLCLLRGYPRSEAAEMLGLTDRALKKVMDSANKKLAGLVSMIQPRGCGEDEWARALRAYALGLTRLDSRDHDRISSHIENCPSCKHYVVGLRGLTVVCPPILPFLSDPSGLLSDLYKLLAAPHSASGSASSLVGGTGGSSTVAAAGSATAGAGVSTAASGSGGAGALASLAGGGLAKVATVAAMVLASGLAGVSALHRAARHPVRQQAVSGHLSELWSSPASIELGTATIHPADHSMTAIPVSRARQQAPRRREHDHIDTLSRSRQRGATHLADQGSPASTSQEFSFERQTPEQSSKAPSTVAPHRASGEEEFSPEG